MSTYEIVFSKENGFKSYYKTTVQADNENDAFIKARNEAESKGVVLPSEVWTRTRKIKGGSK